jgi:hypothetical protein
MTLLRTNLVQLGVAFCTDFCVYYNYPTSAGASTFDRESGSLISHVVNGLCDPPCAEQVNAVLWEPWY